MTESDIGEVIKTVTSRNSQESLPESEILLPVHETGMSLRATYNNGTILYEEGIKVKDKVIEARSKVNLAGYQSLGREAKDFIKTLQLSKDCTFTPYALLNELIHNRLILVGIPSTFPFALFVKVSRQFSVNYVLIRQC